MKIQQKGHWVWKDNMLVTLKTDAQLKMWNKIYDYGSVELMNQRQRRTAFTIQDKMGMDKDGNKRVLIGSLKSNEDVEIIFFSVDFQISLFAARFEEMWRYE